MGKRKRFRNRCKNKLGLTPRPSRLFKYAHFDTDGYHLTNLKNGRLHFSHPSNFNDPFDTKICTDMSMSYKEYVSYVYYRAKREGMPKEWIEDTLAERTDPESHAIKPEYLKELQGRAESHRSTVMNIGITCLSEVWDSLLMWGHYCFKHIGFCLEFDTSYDLFNKTEKVRYSEERPKPKLIKCIKSEKKFDQMLQRQMKTKHTDWSYEKEWRCFATESNVQLPYKKATLKGIIVGLDADSVGVDKLRQIVNDSYDGNVPIYQAREVEGRFALQREKITHT